MDFPVPKLCREPLATLSKMDMQVCPLILCNFFQKGLAKNTQRGLAQRNFKKPGKDEVGYKPKKGDEKLPIEVIQEKEGVRNIQNKKGKLGTFVIHVVYRQDATWQGHMIYQEKNEKKDFVSVLELIKYIDSSLEELVKS